MTATGNGGPVGQLIVQCVAVVAYARLDHQSPRIGARAACHPARRPVADQRFDSADGAADVLALGRLIYTLIVDPAPTVADDFMARFDEGGQRPWIALKCANHPKHAGFDVEVPEDAQQAPDANSRSIFKDRLHQWVALSGIRRCADVIE